jgi:hypothetical protein
VWVACVLGQLFGYDFLLDDELRIWLCEINASPAVADELLPGLVDALIRTAIDPMVAPNAELLTKRCHLQPLPSHNPSHKPSHNHNHDPSHNHNHDPKSYWPSALPRPRPPLAKRGDAPTTLILANHALPAGCSCRVAPLTSRASATARSDEAYAAAAAPVGSGERFECICPGVQREA